MVLKLSRSGRTKETVSEKCNDNDSTNSGHEARGISERRSSEQKIALKKEKFVLLIIVQLKRLNSYP